MADFGTGRWAGDERGECVNGAGTADAEVGHRWRTLSKGVGSLLWMAPEMLEGRKIVAKDAPALDVFRWEHHMML